MQTLLSAAQAAGFEAKLLSADEVIFDDSFRRYCEENRCGNYGVNLSCPPACGTPEQMRKKLTGKTHALVLRSEWTLDWHDAAALREAKRSHNERAQALPAPDGAVYAGAGECTLCEVCAGRTGEPCRFPGKRYSCLSAWCADVAALAEKCGFSYFAEGKVSFFSVTWF